MSWYELIFVLIDLRSFSNLWYWIALAVLWSTASHWIMGVPLDMITRARKLGDQAQADLETLANINAARLLYISRSSGIWIIGITSFLLTTLIVLGFVQDVEFAQAVFFLFAPSMLVGFLSLRTAYAIEQQSPKGDELIGRLMRQRLAVQFIGMISIFVTALFGMYQNLQGG